MYKRILVLLFLAASVLLAGLSDGTATVATAGTRIALSSSTQPVVWVLIQAKSANAGAVYVGGAYVASGRGMRLLPGDVMALPSLDRTNNYNLAQIYIDADNSKDAVTFLYFWR
jgi:hypothetical protein